MKKSFLLLLLCFSLQIGAYAQFVKNTSAKINLSSGIYLRAGQWTNVDAAASTKNNAAQIRLTNNLINNGTFLGNANSLLRFEGAALQYVQGTAVPILYNMQVNNGANHVNLQNSVRVTNNLLLTNGQLFSETAPVFFTPTALNPTETNPNRIIGTAIMEQRTFGAAAFPLFLDAQMAAGTSVGDVTLTRRTGTQGIVTIGANSSIASYWTFETSVAGTRNLTFSWLSALDNGKNLTQLQRWRTEMYNTVASPWLDMSPLANLSARTHTQSEASLQNSWTYSDNVNPLRLIICPSNQTAFTAATACTYTHAGTTWNATSVNTAVTSLTYALTGATTATGLTTLNGAVFNNGVTTVTATAVAGATTQTCSFTVTITDNVLPTITCPANMVILATGASTTVVLPTPATADNCGVASVVLTPASGSSFPVGINTVNAIVTDVNGNTASCSFTVTVVATSPPPTAPSYLIVEGQDTQTLKLRFNDTETNEDGYEIYRSLDGIAWEFHVLTAPWTVGGEVVYYDNINTVADERYFYIVRTKRGSKRSGYTNSAYDYTYPNQPTVSVLQAACANGEGKFKAVGTHTSNKYRWYVSNITTDAIRNNVGDAFDEAIYTTEKLTATRTYYVTAQGKKYESKPRVAALMPVIARPAINVVGALSQRACGNTITLAIEPIAGATFLWTLNGETILGSSGNTFTASQSGVYQVLVNNGSCVTASAQISVATNYKPKAIIRQGKTISFCQSGVISAKAEATAAYEWYKDGVLVGSMADLTVTSSGIYTLKAIESGCENTAEINVNVLSFPANINLTADNETLCQGANAVLTTDNLVGATYNWYRNDRLFATTDLPTLKVRKGGDYQVEAVYNVSCAKRSAVVTVNEATKVVLTQNFDGATLTVNVPSGATATSTTWTIDGEPAPSLNNLLMFKPTKNGVYELTIVWDNGCESKMKTTIILGALGTDEEGENADFNLIVYPNPTKNHLFVSFGKAPKGEVSVVMTDNLGRSVINKTENLASEKLDINITTLPVGLYVLKLNFDGIEKTFKIIKE